MYSHGNACSYYCSCVGNSFPYSLPNILKEIAKEDKEKQNKLIRRTIAKEEVRKIRPPRLGKHKYETRFFFAAIHSCYVLWLTNAFSVNVYFRFEAPPVQVLLTEEMTGSLRKLKVCTLGSLTNFYGPCHVLGR